VNAWLASAGAAATTLWQAAFWVLVHGTVLAAIAWLVSATLLRRARPALIAALWTVVIVKFVLPVGPALPWSLSSALDGLFGGAVPAAAPAAAPSFGPAGPVAAAVAPSISLLGAVALAAATLWLGIVAFLLARRVREQRALRRAAAAAAPASPEVTALVAAVARRIGLGRAPEVRVEHDGAVPWVIGVGRPVLVLPASVVDRAELAAVIGHELAHLRRRDAWLRIVQVVAGALFFFFPVVRWVNRRIDAARELACDAWAIERGPLAPAEYARVLVRLVRRAHEGAAATPAAALALAAHPHLLGKRVDALLAGRGRLRAGVGAPGIVLLAGWGLVALGGASSAEARAAAAPPSCNFTPQLAAEILSAHPEADRDGDGELTRREACDFQLEWERQAADPDEVSLPDDSPFLGDALRLQCGSNGDTSVSPSESLDPPDTCTQD
jgi:beta-lactamase regulating signal transducer with metallopeptidase domain